MCCSICYVFRQHTDGVDGAMKDAAVELEEEMLRRTTLQSGAINSNNQRSHTNDKSASSAEGVQLLSPTLADSFRSKTAPMPELSRKSEYFGWSCSPTHAPSRTRVTIPQAQPPSDNQSGHDEVASTTKAAQRGEHSRKAFDFDGFTLAAVRDRRDDRERERLASSLRVSERAATTSRFSRKNNKSSSGQNSQSAARFRPERSMPVLGIFDDEDPALFAPATFDAQYQQFQLQQQQRYHRGSNHRQQATRRRGGSGHSSSISSSTGSSDVTPPNHRAFASTSAAILAATTANVDVEAAPPSTSSAASGRHRATAVLVSGWLEKRKGLVFKRWRAYYCLFKEDDSLCLYANEDTVNGRLEHRFTVLRVLLTDKNDSFHVIAVDAEGAARREEFRASVSVEWQRWFLMFRRFFDEDSLHEALLRKPELLLLLESPARPPPPPPPPSTLSDVSPKSSGSNDWYRHHQANDDRGSCAAGNQFDNDHEADPEREERPSGGDRCSNDSYNSAETERLAPTARRSNKPLTSRASMSWSRVEPLPVGLKSAHSDSSKGKPRSLSTADGLGWQKTATCESLDGSADELRSTMSLYSVSSGRSAHQPTGEGCGAPRRTAMPSVGWTGDFDLDQRVPASGKKRLGEGGGHVDEDREHHHVPLHERASASTRSSGPDSDSAIGWNWY